jgi:hypothetical protein
LARGQLLPWQRKGTIRDCLRGFVKDIDTTPLHKVKLLTVLRVPVKAYAEILEKQANYSDAVGILRRLTKG